MPFFGEPSRSVIIGAHLSAQQEGELVAFIRENADVFAWDPFELPRVPREVIEHKLAVDHTVCPMKQKVRCQAQDRQEFIIEEVLKLEAAGVVRRIVHSTWTANPVVVTKPNLKKRMCVDFTDLNRACPKDPFPLPRIDQIVDSTAGCDLLCFLDSFSGYHQIRMVVEDEEKTAFITPLGCFCYTWMPFRLKNAGATFQRVMRECMGSQMGHTVEAYIDDIIIKTKNQWSLINDFLETFNNLCKVQLKLNPEKCTFGVPSGKLLGFLVSHRGIEANPDKIKAIEFLQVPRGDKDVKRLNGCITTLGRFISRLGGRTLPFFKLLKSKGPVERTPEAKKSLQDLKKYLASPPILVALERGEPLLMYVAVTNQVVSAVLVAEREEEVLAASMTAQATSDHESTPVAPELTPGAGALLGGSGSRGDHSVPNHRGPPLGAGVLSGIPDLVKSAPRSAWCNGPCTSSAPCCEMPGSDTPQVQKLLMGILLASRKLRHYF
jgi:hypothetical protein